MDADAGVFTPKKPELLRTEVVQKESGTTALSGWFGRFLERRGYRLQRINHSIVAFEFYIQDTLVPLDEKGYVSRDAIDDARDRYSIPKNAVVGWWTCPMDRSVWYAIVTFRWTTERPWP